MSADELGHVFERLGRVELQHVPFSTEEEAAIRLALASAVENFEEAATAMGFSPEMAAVTMSAMVIHLRTLATLSAARERT